MKLNALDYFLHMVLTLSIALMPWQPAAAMTVFNDDGNWQQVTLGNPEEGNAIYRACKNSSDRIIATGPPQSRAVICVTFSQASGAISAGAWIDDAMDEDAHSVHCQLVPSNGKPVSVTCRIKPDRIGMPQIELTNDAALVRKLLKAPNLKIIFESNFLKDGKQLTLEFKPDFASFSTSAPMIFRQLQNQR